MELIIPMGGKSVRRIDAEPKGAKRSKLDGLVDDMSLGNFRNDLITQTVTRKSLDLAFVVDLCKGLNRARLVQRRTMVRGKDGKSYWRMQWVNPNQLTSEHKETGKNHETYQHHEDEIKEMESRQSNKFPVVRMSLDEMQVKRYGYSPDKLAIDEATRKYRNGEPLPPVRVDHNGKIIRGFEYYEMAKQQGLSHVPVIVVGNTQMKKELEKRLRDEVWAEEEDGDEKVKVSLTHDSSKAIHKDPNLPQSAKEDIEHFTKVTAKAYPKEFLMEQAKSLGLNWNSLKKDGTELPSNSQILWMRAHQAITEHIAKGGKFEVKEDKKLIKRHMKETGQGSMQDAFLQVMDAFKGNKQALMEHMNKEGITWPVKKDPSINWMECVKAAKKHLALGKTLAGVRVVRKGEQEKANIEVTDQIKDEVTGKAKKHGKQALMDRATELGIDFNRNNKKGQPLPPNTPILWMRAHQAISEYIAKGNKFLMDGEQEDTQGLAGEIGGYGDLPKWCGYAMDWSVRNSKKHEKETREYGVRCFEIDRGCSREEAERVYDDFVQRARDSKLMIKFDPFENLSNGISLLEQIGSTGTLDNNLILGRGGFDRENIEANEGDLFGDDYTTEVPDKDRPVYAILDLYNTGLESGGGRSYHTGDIAFVLKEEVKKRSTGCHIDSNSFKYGEEGKWTKPLTDPHQLLLDRWRSKWKKPNKKDAQRKRAMEAVMTGNAHTEDMRYFESHIHGGIDVARDVDHILVPSSWQYDDDFTDYFELMVAFSEHLGVGIKFDDED